MCTLVDVIRYMVYAVITKFSFLLFGSDGCETECIFIYLI